MMTITSVPYLQDYAPIVDVSFRAMRYILGL
jgi:hypothetical protein